MEQTIDHCFVISFASAFCLHVVRRHIKLLKTTEFAEGMENFGDKLRSVDSQGVFGNSVRD